MPAGARIRAHPTRSAERTITKFLMAAEEVYGKHGYEGTTIRAIAAKARANLGTLQHYWGSKRELFRDLFERRFRPLQQEHLKRLRAIEQRTANGSRPDVVEVLRTLFETTFFVGNGATASYGPDTETPEGRKRFHTLYGRALMDPSPPVIAEISRIFEQPVKLFLALMARACPQLGAAELDWRVNCIVGAQVFSLVYSERIGRYFGKEAQVGDAVAAKWILHFLMNGMSSPPFEEKQESRLRTGKRAVAMHKSNGRRGSSRRAQSSTG
jgi:AcrR family transcriptional regulator